MIVQPFTECLPCDFWGEQNGQLLENALELWWWAQVRGEMSVQKLTLKITSLEVILLLTFILKLRFLRLSSNPMVSIPYFRSTGSPESMDWGVECVTSVRYVWALTRAGILGSVFDVVRCCFSACFVGLTWKAGTEVVSCHCGAALRPAWKSSRPPRYLNIRPRRPTSSDRAAFSSQIAVVLLGKKNERRSKFNQMWG